MALWRKMFDDPFFNNQNSSIFNMKQADWIPKMDIKENENAITFSAELPGMTLDDVSVEVHNDVLTIRGEKKQEIKDEKENYHRIERRYGSFHRSFHLPENVKEEDIAASLKNGVLHVVVPKPAIVLPPGPKKIAISHE
jgi:HSP20 family protein